MSESSKTKVLKSEQTKLRIMDSYLNLISSNKWDKISVKEICSYSNITRGTFYLYFNDIYDLIEQIQEPLLAELNNLYQNQNYKLQPFNGYDTFEENFDCTPPEPIVLWFEFCEKNKDRISVLLSQHSDPYFITKLKTILSKQINLIMDGENMPDDILRKHFKKTYLELHFLVVRTWLNSSDDDFISVDEIITVLNTMRIGAHYLSYHDKKNTKVID